MQPYFQEDFLHFVWQYRLFNQADLQTDTGEPVQILHPGIKNTHEGPDFLEARIKIGDTLWAGQVEIHLRSSDWEKHNHNQNRNYDNVTLHLVWENDRPIMSHKGFFVPCVELAGRIPARILDRYRKLSGEMAEFVPCASMLGEIRQLQKLSWLERLSLERLEEQVNRIEILFQTNGQNLEDSFYRHLARAYGLPKNGEPFEALAASIPLKILAKHKNNLQQIESLLFGNAGLLPQMTEKKDEYSRALEDEYRFLASKYNLSPIVHPWKFLRMRPASFPSVRLAQFAQLIFRSSHLFSKILDTDSLSRLKSLFLVEPSDYWSTHYTFGKPSLNRPKKPGADFLDLLLINTIIPWLYFHGQLTGNRQEMERALIFLEQLPPEKNSVLNQWNRAGIKPETAGQGQGLLFLKKNFCDKKRCLQCRFGHSILNKSEDSILA